MFLVNTFKFKASKRTNENNKEEIKSLPLSTEDSELISSEENSSSGGVDFMDYLTASEDRRDPIDVGIELLLNPKNIMMKTDVPAQAIPVLARAIALAKKYKSESLLEYLDNYHA